MDSPSNLRNNTNEDDDQRVSIDKAIRLAVDLQKQSKLDQAEGIYRKVLDAVPNHPDALHFLGVLYYQRKLTDDAIQSISLALEASPDYVDAHNNLGNIFKEQKRLEEAEACYRRTVELAPAHLGAWNNLGTVLRSMKRPQASESVFRDTLKLSDDFFPLHYNLSNLLYEQGRVAEAVDHMFRAIVLDPEQADSKVMLGIALASLGRTREAVAHYHQWLKEDPDNPEALHLLAACSDDALPERASDEYVKIMFDRFADSFEEKLGILNYKAPNLVADALVQACGDPAGDLDILDAGCGTGLCGSLIRPHARQLDGVDLSAGMLKQAAESSSYHRLEEAELTAFLTACQGAYDVVVSADTLCYFGDLRAVFTAAAGSLKPKGHFIFTVELAEESQAGTNGEFRMLPQGRYAHTESYLQQTARDSGLTPITTNLAVLRQEMGRPVDGLVVTLVPA